MSSDLGPSYLEVHGQSMRPIIREGEKIIVEWFYNDTRQAKQNHSIDVGQICVISSRPLTVHRVIAISNDKKSVLTKGDASYVFDDWIDVDHVLGRVVGIVGSNEIKINYNFFDRLIAFFSSRHWRRVVYLLSIFRKGHWC